MRTNVTAVIVAVIVAFAGASVSAAPCTTATPNCTEWVKLHGGPAQSLIYRSHPLTVRNDGIVRALIVVHGAGRDADNYFRTAMAATFLAGALDDTIVISPRFASLDSGCADMLAPNEVSWSCNGDSWRSGGAARSDASLTSYDFADEILRQLAGKNVFPNLRRIVVSGHSAGGQFANRYEMANRVHDTLGIPITYVVANPSSYAYLEPVRPTADGKEFRAFGDGRNCTTYDNWPYGLQKRTGYAGTIPDEQLKKQLISRPTTYLVGELDTLPLAGFDSSCPAMAQGANRNLRGQAFAKYVNERLGAQHAFAVIGLCGHNARCMFTSDVALAVLFPKP